MAKIKYGISNCYYAKATIASNGSATYATPVALPGAVNLSLDAQGDTNEFFADNIVYYTSVSNTGYEGWSNRSTESIIANLYAINPIRRTDGVMPTPYVSEISNCQCSKSSLNFLICPSVNTNSIL